VDVAKLALRVMDSVLLGSNSKMAPKETLGNKPLEA